MIFWTVILFVIVQASLVQQERQDQVGLVVHKDQLVRGEVLARVVSQDLRDKLAHRACRAILDKQVAY